MAEQSTRKDSTLKLGAARILESAMELFASHGYTATGIRDIARAAGISSSVLYNHFDSKEEILVGIMRDGFETLTQRARHAVGDETASDKQLAALVRGHVYFETEQQRRARVMTVEFRFLGTSARSAIVPVRDAYECVWDEVIKKGIERGIFRVRDVQMARLGILGMCAGPGRWYWHDQPVKPDVIADAYAEMALNVLGVRASR
ncbi:TetR/AcrR family transcriptional regulator [Mycolicibacterium sp.]|uniref:TetR/AcrR family transcriptional regulator n=1 Tax=Mycolicibacterium sp. TaxID=2320850 RepID=UPI00355FC3FF